MKRMKKLLAFLLATMLLLTMIPISASAAVNDSDQYFSFDYVDRQSDLLYAPYTVNLLKPDGSTLTSLRVDDYALNSREERTITLKDSCNYEIESLSVNKGDLDVSRVESKSVDFVHSFPTEWDGAVLNVQLADPFNTEDVTINGTEIITDADITYKLTVAEIAKLLAKVDPEVENGFSVKDTDLRFVKSNHEMETKGMYFADGYVGTSYLPYYQANPSNVSGLATPYNIRQLEITYEVNGEEKVAKIPTSDYMYTRSEDLADPSYLIEAKGQENTHAVVFLNMEGDDWGKQYSFYAIRFVEDGGVVENMPADPTYPNHYDSGYEFVGWDYSQDGSQPFLAYKPITSDVVLYAMKVPTGGVSTSLEYKIWNQDDALVKRLQEIYNATAEIPGTITVEKARINGEGSRHTNENYRGNKWKDDNDYYVIKNYDADVVGTEHLDTYNVQIPFSEARSATFFIKVNGVEVDPITLPIDNETPGALSITMDTGDFKAHVAELYVNPPLDPPEEGDLTDDPDGDDPTYPIVGLVDNAVKIDCVNDEIDPAHGDKIYGLLEGTFTVGEEPYWVGDDTKTGYYAVDITVDVDSLKSYIDLFDTTTTAEHKAVEGQEDQTITLKLNGGEWVLAPGTTTPVTYQVECETPGEPDEPDEKPEAPDDTWLENIENVKVKVDCTTNDQHYDDEYALEEVTYTAPTDEDVTEGTTEGTYTCSLTIKKQPYVTMYGADHKMKGTDESVTIILTYSDRQWQPATATITVTCDGPDGPDDPTEPDEPTAPTYDDLKALIDVTVACTNTQINPAHPNGEYELMQGTYDVVKGSTGNTCTVTIRAGDYIVKYERENGNVPHGLTNATGTGSVNVNLVNEGNGWKLANGSASTTITFEVKCGSTIVRVPGEDKWYPVYVDPEDPTDPDQTGVSDLLETDDHIQYLFGYPDGSFGPDRNMTRAEAAQMFYNLLKNKNVDAEPAFDDVPEGAWYATPVNVMAELGIVDGVGDDKFEPNREITRAEFTTMAMRFAKVPSGGVNIFTDVAPSDWFYSYVVNSIQYGWIEGYGDGTFRPDRLITRAEVTTIVNRMLDRQADMAYVIQHRAELNQFTDLTTEHWAYYTIVEATNEHNYKKPAIGEDWTSLIK